MKVLINGASGAIGKAICEKFLENGHDVYGIDIQQTDLSHPNYVHIIHDIKNTAYPAIDRVAVVINSAGICEQSSEDIAVNLTAVVNFTEHYAFQEHIKAVINISSASAITGSEFPHYAASKGGLTAYTKNIAMRLAEYGATANSICPGAVETDFNKHILEDKSLYDAVANESLLKKWAEPCEIAEWTYFLVCVNKSMTGENLLIDNGEAIKQNFIW